MPGPFDPLVPQSWIKPLQDKLDTRSLDESVVGAQLRGFGAGALEGLRGLTSPANLAGMIPSAGLGAKLAPRMMTRMAAPAMELIEDLPAVQQVMPHMDEVNELISTLKQNLGSVPRSHSIPNAGPVIKGLKTAADPLQHAFNEGQVTKYLSKVR